MHRWSNVSFRKFTATVLFMLSALLPRQVSAADSLSLSAAISRSLEKNLMLQQNTLATDASTAEVQVVRSRYLPQLTFDGSYTRLGPLPEINFGESSLALYPANNYNASVELRQTLYDFGKTNAAVDLANSQVRNDSDRIFSTRGQIVYQTARSFYTILLLRQSVSVQDEQIRALKEHQALIGKKIANGTATEYDSLTTEVRLATARNTLINYHDALNREEIAFRRYLDLPARGDVMLSGDFIPDTTDVNIDSVLTLSLERSPAVRIAGDAVISAERSLASADASDRPSLFLTGMYGFRNGFFPNPDAIRGNYEAGIGFQYPVFDGFITKYRRSAAEIRLESARLNLRDSRDHLSMQIRQSVTDVDASRERLRNSHAVIEQAKKALTMAATRYRAGTITNLDVLDAETALLQAQLTELQSLYDTIISRYVLLHVSGALSEWNNQGK